MTKTELQGYVKLSMEVIGLEEELELLEAQLYRPRMALLTGMPRGGSPVTIADKLAKLENLKLQYQKKWDKAMAQRKHIETAIDTLTCPIERTIMRYKYIHGHTWETICDKTHYCWDSVHRYHNKALKNLQSF